MARRYDLSKYDRRWLAYINITLGVFCLTGTADAWVKWAFYGASVWRPAVATAATVIFWLIFRWAYRVRE